MRNTQIKYFFIPALLIFLSACGSSEVVYEGIKHPQTSDIQVSFQEHAVPDECFAFAHLLMNTKMQSSGQNIANAMHAEAMAKGANLVLVGLAREVVEEELEENRFDYYGPDYSYNFNKTWLGWKFGFDEWTEGDDLVGLGANSWGNSDMSFPYTLLVQAVFMRCGDNGTVKDSL